MIRSIFGVEVPDWFKDELQKRFAEPDENDVLGVLLEDYLKRNEPCVHEFVDPVLFWDPHSMTHNLDEVVCCRKCGVGKDGSPGREKR